MESYKLTNEKLEKLVNKIEHTYKDGSGINFIDSLNLPVQTKILHILELFFEVLFPGNAGKREVTKTNITFILGDLLCQIYAELSQQIARAYLHQCRMDDCQSHDCTVMAQEVTEQLLEKLPKIRELLKLDVQAAFNGDPAAKSFEEIVISYPCIQAIATHRVAHELYLREVPLIPRIMSECAHTKTGVDIHPGAAIGEYFFIDHGTGVVIGETTKIGNNVKIYQGVTLGAMAPAKGQVLRNVKRHPTIENDVTIYPDATILGNVTIGKAVVIGGNVWIKESVPQGMTVTTSNPELIYIEHKKK